MNKTYKRILILVTLILLLILYLINSTLIINEIINYTNLFFTKLFPVTFIFFILSSLLLDYGIIELFSKYLKLNTSNLYILLMSMISGFPSGSKYTKELLEKNLITTKEANKIIMYTHFPNPLFVLGTVNNIINNKIITIKILISIIISNIIILLFTKEKNKTPIIYNYNYPKNFANSLTKAALSSTKTILIIYTTSIFFYLITVIINKYFLLSPNQYVLLNGIFDLTKGVTSASILSNQLQKSIYIIFFISFGGISIHMQVKSILSDTSIKYKNFLLGRILSTIITIFIFLLLLIN